MYAPSLGLISWAVCLKYTETLPSRQFGVQEMARMQLSMIKMQSNEYLCGSHESVMDGQTDGRTSERMDRQTHFCCLPPHRLLFNSIWGLIIHQVSLFTLFASQQLTARPICISLSPVWRQVYLSSPAQVTFRYPITTKLLLEKMTGLSVEQIQWQLLGNYSTAYD